MNVKIAGHDRPVRAPGALPSPIGLLPASENAKWVGMLVSFALGLILSTAHIAGSPAPFGLAFLAAMGYGSGVHAPGLSLPAPELARIIHHVLCAHGKSVAALREYDSAASIGWASAVGPNAPAAAFGQDEEVINAARAAHSMVQAGKDVAWGSPVWADPIHLGHYPEAFLREHGNDLPPDWERDLAAIRAPLDFCGMNIYGTSDHFARDAGGECRRILQPDFGPGFPRTYFGWPVTPECLYWGPKFYHERYKVPIAITENGMSGLDWVALDGGVHDPARVDFLARYLAELRRAIADGVEVLGYFHWSLLDNFEWADGFRQRFGLIHVDYGTGKRTPKDSARWYRQVIADNGASVPFPAAECACEPA